MRFSHWKLNPQIRGGSQIRRHGGQCLRFGSCQCGPASDSGFENLPTLVCQCSTRRSCPYCRPAHTQGTQSAPASLGHPRRHRVARLRRVVFVDQPHVDARVVGLVLDVVQQAGERHLVRLVVDVPHLVVVLTFSPSEIETDSCSDEREDKESDNCVDNLGEGEEIRPCVGRSGLIGWRVRRCSCRMCR